MRIKYYCLLIVVVLCAGCADAPATFDEHILHELNKYDYETSEITDEGFKDLKETIREKQFNLNKALSPFSLVHYINHFQPEISEVRSKYENLDTNERQAFIREAILHCGEYFKNHRNDFYKLIQELQSNDQDKTTKDILLLYASSPQPSSKEFERILAKILHFRLQEQLLLTRIIEAEKETAFAFQLLSYLHARNDWSSTMSYVNYKALSNTKNATLNAQYKNFFREEILQRRLDEKPWKGYSALIGKWFTPEEIIDICKKTLQRNATYQYYFQGQLQKFSIADLYTINCAYYQSVYFPVAETIDLIEKCSHPYLRLHLAYILSNTREDISDSERQRLYTLIKNTGQTLSSASEAKLFVLVCRSIQPQLSFIEISSAFPLIASNGSLRDSLESIHQASRKHWRDVKDSCNQQNIFRIKLNDPDAFTLNEYMADNYALRLDNAATLETLLTINGLVVNLSGKWGIWPDDIAMFNESTKAVAQSIGLKLQFLSDPENEEENTFYLMVGNKLHKVVFDNKDIRASHEVLYLLLNKSLIDATVTERLVKLQDDYHALVFVQPEKFSQLMKGVK